MRQRVADHLPVVADYQLRVDGKDLQSLQLDSLRDAQVIVVVSRQEERLTVNLRAPLLINVENRRGCQVVAKDAYPVRYPLSSCTLPLRRTA